MGFEVSHIIIWAVVGAVVGWLANQIMTKGGLGLQNDLIVGVVGAVLGGFIFPAFFFLGGPQALLLGHIVNAALGAVIATFVARYVLQSQSKSKT
jgi:uncharacterized membrane protein YeaQ/YmgE (transglycosylase-associated protein family)